MPEKKKSCNDLAAQLAARGYGPDQKARDVSPDEIRRAVRGKKTPSRPAPSTTQPEQEIVYRRDIPRQSPSPPTRKRSGPPVDLEKSIEGMEMRHAHGAGFVVTTRADDLEAIQPISTRFEELIATDTSGLFARVDVVCNPTRIEPQDIIFMDVESTGLGNSPLFLIGIMIWNGSSFEIQQFFARNYAEEAAVIAFFLDACASRKLLITFNGKSFDFPYIRARAATTSVPFTIEPYHLDMLHVCRRIWKKALPDCKLQTLEKFICKRHRHGDIPGSEIPDAYHEYVRSADAWQMVDVLKHNLLDLLTMADLMNRFPEMVVEQKPTKGSKKKGGPSK
jgi:uncharacterized protein YprB with RNaseH-like and TPR domain